MSHSIWRVLATAALVAALGSGTASVSAQTAEVKEKPRMFTYEASWVIPRARWGDVAKDNAAGNQKVLAPALADGTLVGYGDEENLVHSADGATHDGWWMAGSMAQVMKILDSFYKIPTAPALMSATKHWDSIYVTRYYNWKPGTYKDAYASSASYKFKADAPNDALDTLSKNLFVPLFEKLLADGVIAEYEVDQEAVHTESPDLFYLYYVVPTADGLDKVNQAVRDAVKGNPLANPAFGSMIDFTGHRDHLSRANVTFK
jgi:hypothetical protein